VGLCPPGESERKKAYSASMADTGKILVTWVTGNVGSAVLGNLGTTDGTCGR
jgi:hypothetical protein